MSSTLEQVFSDIANSIRSKTGTTDSISPLNMSTTIDEIPKGPDYLEFQQLYTDSALAQGITESKMTIKINQSTRMSTYSGSNPEYYAWFDGNGSSYYYIGNYYRNNFNSPVIIGENVVNAFNGFRNLYNFNQPVTIPANCTNFAYIFRGCSSLNSPITIETNSNSIFDCSGMFSGCTNFDSIVYLNGTLAPHFFTGSGILNTKTNVEKKCNNRFKYDKLF